MSIPRLVTALNFIDDDLLSQAAVYSHPRTDLHKTFCIRASLIACVCIIVAIVMRSISTIPTDELVLPYPNGTHPHQSEEFQSSTPDVANIQINEISPDYFSDQGMFGFYVDNFEEMTRDELLKHFGVTFDLSTVLPDMHEATDTRYGLYHFGDGSVFEQFTFVYKNSKADQAVYIVLSNGGLPIGSINEAHMHGLQKSTLYDKEMLIAHYTNLAGISIYYAEFIDGDLGVVVSAENCSVEDYIRILKFLAQSSEGTD